MEIQQTVDSYAKHDDVISGLVWLATLDFNTCIQCAARDLKKYTLEGVPIGHNIAFLPIPLHVDCRCTLLPGVKPWQDLGVKDAKILQILNNWENRMGRYSVFGPVSANMDFSAWLRTLYECKQEQYLGKTRFSLWRENVNLHLSYFIS